MVSRNVWQLITCVQDPERLSKLKQQCCLVHWALDLMGMQVQQPDIVLAEIKRFVLARAGLTEQQVQEAIEARGQARKDKAFEQADKIRDEYAAKGIVFRDGTEGTDWYPASSSQAV